MFHIILKKLESSVGSLYFRTELYSTDWLQKTTEIRISRRKSESQTIWMLRESVINTNIW